MGQPDARQANSDEMRKQGIVDRLTSGTNSRVTQMSDKHFEKFVRHNSVGRHCEAELREERAESKPEDSTFGPVTSLGTPIGARAQSIKRAQGIKAGQEVRDQSYVVQMSDKQFQRFVRKNSVGGRRLDEMQKVRTQSKATNFACVPTAA